MTPVEMFIAGVQLFAQIITGKISIGNITNIKRWENQTQHTVDVWKFDNDDPNTRRDQYQIGPGQTVDGDMWVPWLDNGQNGYPGRHGVIQVDGQPLAFFWEHHGNLYFNTIDQYDGYMPMPGIPRADGDRRIVIGTAPNGAVTFVIAGYPAA